MPKKLANFIDRLMSALEREIDSDRAHPVHTLLRVSAIPGTLMLTVPTAEFNTGKNSRSSMVNDSNFAMAALYGASSIDLMHSFFNFFNKSAIKPETNNSDI